MGALKTGLAVAVALLLLVGAGVAWWQVGQEREARRAALEAAEQFVEAWEAGAWDELGAATDDPAAGEAHREAWAAIGVEEGAVELVDADVEAAVDGVARASYRVDVSLTGFGGWGYDGELELARLEDEDWKVVWEPAVLHPELREGQQLARSRRWPTRAPLLDRHGEELVTSEGRGAVGLIPERITDVAAAIEMLEAEAGVAPADVEAAHAEGGGEFVPLATLSPEELEAAGEAIEAVPGVVLRADPEDRAGQASIPGLGSVGQITAEQLEELGEPYLPGDVIGQGGIEARFEERLAGEPGGTVRIVQADDRSLVTVLESFDAAEPEALRLSLDPDVQATAQAALGTGGEPAALVAVDIGSGEILAASNRPPSGFERALGGRYAPGSTFKTVTAVAALADGVDASDMVSCPQTVTISGRSFRNAGFAALGSIDFAEAFAESCNTAFVQVATDLSEGALVEAAGWFGFTDDDTGDAVFPAPGDPVETAAASIGQARVLATPAHMASVAAAVASGQWRAATLVADNPEQESADPLPEDVATTMGELMRGVVTEGTGTPAAVAGRDVRGKTGSAEFGTGDDLETHAWFIGYEGDVAFAVLVEGGGAGGGVAGPIAADFVRGL